MVSTLDELRTAKSLIQPYITDNIKIGIMVEVPAVALMAEQFAPEVDFFSIGTNDLTQYTLAMDRGNAKLQPDGLNPAVLQLISLTVQAAHRHGKWVGVCGGIASDAAAIPVLIGLGVDELSVSAPAISSIKAQIRQLNFTACQTLAQKVLTLDTDVRKYITQ
jgi:phosphoenolpyruvate-protein kinase (PTS system EI component)